MINTQKAFPSFQFAATMTSKHLQLVQTFLLGFLLIKSTKARAESKHLQLVLTFLLGFLLIKSTKARAESMAGYGEDRISNVAVVGNVFCDTCLENQFLQESSHVITGALIALECSLNRKATAQVTVGKSDEYGDFSVDVPSSFHPEERMDRCSVKLLNSPEGSCNTPSTNSTSKLALVSNSNGVRTYTAGSLSYRPQHIPRLCYKETVREA